MLKRSQRIRSQEDLVLPLYEPLAKSVAEGDFRAPFFSILCALAVTSNDTLWEKLTFITHLFDVNENKVGATVLRFTREALCGPDSYPSKCLPARCMPRLVKIDHLWRNIPNRHGHTAAMLYFLFDSAVCSTSVHGQGRDLHDAGHTRQCFG